MDLSILIPARNEEYLAETVKCILANIEGDTEIIIVADGNWPDPPINDHPRVTMVYHSESIGQRAATNEAAKMSTAKFIMKCDAHCAFDKGFDVKLMQEFEYDWTIIPRMYNLHVFNWRCPGCQNETYQGPMPTKCSKCGNIDEFEKVIVWTPRWNCRSDFMRFDSDLHFQYWSEFQKRPESKGDIAPTMSLLGACWMLHRERYWEIGGMDETHGSWGQMGTELACKSWLSGGKLLVNKRTWFSHLFRTQPGFGFPYPNPGIQNARKRSRELWLGNKWPLAKYPLSWLLRKFAPIPGWEEEQIRSLETTTQVAVPSFAVETEEVEEAVPAQGEEQAIPTNEKTEEPADESHFNEIPVSDEDKAPVDESTDVPIADPNEEPVAPDEEITRDVVVPDVVSDVVSDNVVVPDHAIVPEVLTEVTRMEVIGTDIEADIVVTATADYMTTQMVINVCDDDEPMPVEDISNAVQATSPVSANRPKRPVTIDVKSTPVQALPTNLTKGCVYYTDNNLDDIIAVAVQRQLDIANKGIELISVSLKPMYFGKNFLVQGERGYLTMFQQILLGIEQSSADIIFLTEHDILYHPSHFDFVPPRDDVYYYNENTWKVDAYDGRAVFYYTKQTSGCCAYRKLLLQHYRTRVDRVAKEGFTRAMGFEPGCHLFPRGVDNYKADSWMSEFPNIDIRHKNNLTQSRWSQDQFRSQRSCKGWTLADEVPGWGVTKDKFPQFLASLANPHQQIS